VIRVQGHKVKYSNSNNAAADCSILFKFGTAFHVTGDTLEMFEINGQRSRLQREESIRGKNSIKTARDKR